MKILYSPSHYVFSDTLGSEFYWAFNIVNRIAIKNPDSEVITGIADVKRKLPYRLLATTSHYHKIDMGLKASIIFNYQYTMATFRAIHKEHFDIVHHLLPFGVGYTFNIFSFFRGSTPLIVGPVQSPPTVDESNVDLSNWGKIQLKTNRLNKLILSCIRPFTNFLSIHTLQSAQAVVVINQTTKDLLIDLGVNPDKITIIPPGIDVSIYQPTNSTVTTRVNLLSVGNLIPRKNFGDLLRAMTIIRQKCPQVHLTIVGEGPLHAQLEELITELGLTREVKIAGSVPHTQIKNEYHQSDIFVSMSNSEGFSTVGLEALASGLPIVSTSVGGFADIVINDVNGYLVEPGNYRDLAYKVIDIVSSKEKLKLFGAQSTKLAKKHYDWDTCIIPKYISLYHSLCS